MLGNITQEQHTAARVAGFMYLLLGALAAFAEFYVRSGILVYGDAAQTAHNIVASERLFRIGIATDLIGGACNAILAVAFYTMLKQVSSSLALLAAFWRIGEAVILGHMTLNGMTVLNILSPSALSGVFSPGQLQALASLYIGTQGDEFSIGLVYYSLGSTLFCYLLLKSRYVPRILAWWGLVSSFVALISTLAIIVFPGADGIAPGCYAPVGIFEIVTGFWLLVAGVPFKSWCPAFPEGRLHRQMTLELSANSLSVANTRGDQIGRVSHPRCQTKSGIGHEHLNCASFGHELLD